MDHDEFTNRLKAVGLGPKELPRSTLRNWAREGLIPRPTPYSKPGKQGRYRNWPEEAVEQAAAVWALRNLKSDRFLSRPPSNTIKRVKFEATDTYETFENDADFHHKIHNRSFDPEGKEGYYLKSYDLHPFIVTWIATIEKVRHKMSVNEPANVIFDWKSHLVREGEFELRYDGVTVEPSDYNRISRRYSHTRETMRKLLGREPTDWAKAKREGQVISLGQNTDWDNVGFDVENQLIIVRDPKKKEYTVIAVGDSKDGVPEISDEMLSDPKLFKHDKPYVKAPDTKPGEDPEADKAYLKKVAQYLKEREQGASKKAAQ